MEIARHAEMITCRAKGILKTAGDGRDIIDVIEDIEYHVIVDAFKDGEAQKEAQFLLDGARDDLALRPADPLKWDCLDSMKVTVPIDNEGTHNTRRSMTSHR